MTHDYKRHGTTTLFAVLSVLDGTVIGRCMQRHRPLEFIRFLNAVERQVAAGKPIHVVLDNDATHKHPKVLAWLSRHARWTFHFTPTSAPWLNAVENFDRVRVTVSLSGPTRTYVSDPIATRFRGIVEPVSDSASHITVPINIKAWLVATHHRVSAKHLPRYLREWKLHSLL
jgi:hypothetical protein